MSKQPTKVIASTSLVLMMSFYSSAAAETRMTENVFSDGRYKTKLKVEQAAEGNRYTLTTTVPLRDNEPAGKTRTFSERTGFPRIRTGNTFFDALYTLALDDALLNAVSQIRDGNFEVRETMNQPFFQTGEKWTYVWTRDISYSVDLGLASLDPQRCMNSLLFKTTTLKPGIEGLYSRQIVQDTGSGGSYPVSTDRVVWAFGTEELLKYLNRDVREKFSEDALQIMHDTIEHDRNVIFDPQDGLYRGEQSFLDWREQSYPGWTKDNVLSIAQSKTLSTNIGHYQLLKTAAGLAAQKGLVKLQEKYEEWADTLKYNINKEFYIESKGLYSSIILNEPIKIRLNRYDLLGQSLAILCKIADSEKSKQVIENYPQSQYGPPVVWPQEQTVPIYHNHAFWPFVTAYWLKAAKVVGNSAAVDQAVYSLVRGTALNLSNMENFDFVTGKTYAEVNAISGPVINSRRQLWSVAGYMAMVQDIVFGLETDWDGIRFLPCVTVGMHREYFKDSKSLILKDFRYRDKTVTVTVTLPPMTDEESGIYEVQKITLNRKPIKNDFIPAEQLKSENHWDIWLTKSTNTSSEKIKQIDNLRRRNIFGPKQPRWKTMGQAGVTIENGKLKLNYDANSETNVRFNIYRNGEICADGITETEWTDPDSADYRDTVYYYMIEAVYPDSRNCSHLTPARSYVPAENKIEMCAASMKNKGGNLVNEHHLENWGLPEHEIQTLPFKVEKSGLYLINAEYSNGASPINTGVTCAVKRIEISENGSSEPVAVSYLIMPHTADWTRYLDSSSFQADLKGGHTYTVKIFEDAYSRNMSYFDHYEPYKSTGNGTKPYNYVNISKVKLIRLKD